MRIIAGEFRSRPLKTLKGNSTRPTLDKVKEALFSSLGGYFDGGIVLDLYAGSGAIGLEAISRGMDKAYFCDSSKLATSVIKENISLLNVKERCEVFTIKDTLMLKKMIDKNIQFSFVYLDPPYRKQNNIEVLKSLDSNDLIKENGWVVIESLKEESYKFDSFQHLRFMKEVTYGIMKLTYYRNQ